MWFPRFPIGLSGIKQHCYYTRLLSCKQTFFGFFSSVRVHFAKRTYDLGRILERVALSFVGFIGRKDFELQPFSGAVFRGVFRVLSFLLCFPFSFGIWFDICCHR